MPDTPRLLLLLAAVGWAIWYFARLVWIGLSTGELIDSDPPDGVPVTRAGKPKVFWFSMVISLLLLPLFLWGAFMIGGDLLGLWDSEF